jgi:hypothetical protein
MITSTPPIIFRPRRYDAVLCGIAVLLSLVFVAAGVACFIVVGPHIFSFAFTGIGIIAAAAAVGSMFVRTVITSDGIAKRPRIAGGFTLRWQEVDSWEQLPRRFDDAPCVRFRIRGSRFPRVVFDYEVEQPGFESFLSYVRQHVSQREAA